MIDLTTLGNTVGSFPNIVGKNATSPSAQDGTPFVAAYIDNDWGWQQFIMDYVGLTPTGVTESSSVSQIVEAFQLAFNTGPGSLVMYDKAALPAVTGDRVLILSGQGILRANYTELDAAVYVGDGNNASVAAGGGAYYHADDAAGVTPNIAGVYLILPDYRGRVPRGEDAGAIVDPDGASRFLGGVQEDAFQGHLYEIMQSIAGANASQNAFSTGDTLSGYGSAMINTTPVADGTNGTPRTSSESRMTNTQTRFGIIY